MVLMISMLTGHGSSPTCTYACQKRKLADEATHDTSTSVVNDNTPQPRPDAISLLARRHFSSRATAIIAAIVNHAALMFSLGLSRNRPLVVSPRLMSCIRCILGWRVCSISHIRCPDLASIMLHFKHRGQLTFSFGLRGLIIRRGKLRLREGCPILYLTEAGYPCAAF